jgi:hypothetical protein
MNKPLLQEMLTYKRKSFTDSIKKFSEIYLHPTFGFPDKHGNYELIVGDNPTTVFAAHYDSVHDDSGRQNVVIRDGIIGLHKNSKSSCLGADCATGIWLILAMIDAGIEGVYVVHAEEETGCIGSGHLVASNPWWLSQVTAVISFDRKGQEDIITHQMGLRTASDKFAKSLSDILGLDHEACPNGSFTDSNEYAEIVPECTNLAVGYLNQHTALETQDLNYALKLRDALLKADWSKLEIDRDPAVQDFLADQDWRFHQRGSYRDTYSSYYGYDDGWGQTYSVGAHTSGDTVEDFYEVIVAHPEALAKYLYTVYSDIDELLEELEPHGARTAIERLFRK